MNLTKYFNKSLHIGQFMLDSKFKIFGKKKFNEARNVLLYFNKTYCNTNGLIVKTDGSSKKRLIKKKKVWPSEAECLRIMAFSTAEEYRLENLSLALPSATDFKPSTFGSTFSNSIDVLHATISPTMSKKNELECQDLFFFRKGCLVMWNISDNEIQKILKFLKNYEDGSFKEELVQNESEVMSYSVSQDLPQSQIHLDNLMLSTKSDLLLDKYAVSNALALSVQLGTYEACLEQYIDTMKPITDDLKSGNRIKMTRSEVLQKTGHLFALRHNINLNSDLLDTPDFYWDREELEKLYQAIFNYFCISKRTRVINEKINHCIELVELLSSHLNDKHHVRLEWMIIVLIMVEVCFEVLHYVNRHSV